MPAADAATGAGTGWAVAAGAGAASGAASPVWSSRIMSPSDTVSPTATRSPVTVPPVGAGTSMVALSDSRVTRGSSAEMVSPAATWTSMTGTSR